MVEMAELYDALLAATADDDAPPTALLADARQAARAAEIDAVDALPHRARVVMRLLREGAEEVAWLVLVDNATGVVGRRFSAATSSGAERVDWPLPLLTKVEPPRVYADLPGFRDPRFDVPDAAYELGDAIKLRCHIDEVRPGPRPVLAGWAALDVLTTEPDDAVSVVAAHAGGEISWSGVRHRRADLVGGSRDLLRRRAWAGWSAELDPVALPSDGSDCELWLELTQAGLTRRARLGRPAGELALRLVGQQVCERPRTQLVGGPGGWSLQRRR